MGFLFLIPPGLLVKSFRLVTGHLRDTLHIRHLFPPVSTAICHKFHRNLPQSAVFAKFCHNLLFLPNSAKSAEFRPNRDNAQYSTVNLATKLMIYTSSSLFFTFFPYATS